MAFDVQGSKHRGHSRATGTILSAPSSPGGSCVEVTEGGCAALGLGVMPQNVALPPMLANSSCIATMALIISLPSGAFRTRSSRLFLFSMRDSDVSRGTLL